MYNTAETIAKLYGNYREMITQVADILIKKYALCHVKIVCPISYWKHMPYALQTDSVTGKYMPYQRLCLNGSMPY